MNGRKCDLYKPGDSSGSCVLTTETLALGRPFLDLRLRFPFSGRPKTAQLSGFPAEDEACGALWHYRLRPLPISLPTSQLGARNSLSAPHRPASAGRERVQSPPQTGSRHARPPVGRACAARARRVWPPRAPRRATSAQARRPMRVCMCGREDGGGGGSSVRSQTSAEAH